MKEEVNVLQYSMSLASNRNNPIFSGNKQRWPKAKKSSRKSGIKGKRRN